MFVENGKESVDLLLAVDDLDDDRQILRQRQQVPFVQPARMAEAEGAAQHRGARQMRRAGLLDDGDVERRHAATVADAGEYPQQHGVMRHVHVEPHALFRPQRIARTLSSVTRPLATIVSRMGRKRSIWSALSTISTTIGWRGPASTSSSDRTWRDGPKPSGPGSTVAPASFISRARSTMAS
jgi:hypothetical protein